MSAEELETAAIRARADAATSGPWDHWPEGGDIEVTANRHSDIIVSRVRPRLGWSAEIYVDNQEPDAAFIAHARTDVPALLDEVDRLRKAIEAAPHGDDCRAFPQFAALLGIAARPCTCWKASAVGTNNEEGN